MWFPYRTTNFESPNCQSRILLAHHGRGRQAICTKVPGMSCACQRHPCPAHRFAHLGFPLAIHAMGNGYCQTISPGTDPKEIPPSRHRLFYQMGRGRGPDNDNHTTGAKIHVKANLLVWASPNVVTNNCRQFVDRKLGKFYRGLGIKHKTGSMEHPQTNDLV